MAFFNVGDHDCFALDALALTSRVMGAAGERAFQNFENCMCVRQGNMVGLDG